MFCPFCNADDTKVIDSRLVADGGQVRYLSIRPTRDEVLETIELVTPDHHTAPLIVAMTLEVPGSHVDGEVHEDN